MSQKLRYTLPGGAVLEGTAAEIIAFAGSAGIAIDTSKLVPPGHYLSNTHGLVKITDMDIMHIVNALNKRVVEYYESIRPKKEEGVAKYLDDFTELTHDGQIAELYMEVNRRVRAGLVKKP
jgi:hypothetical protein